MSRLNEHVLNKYALRTRSFRESRSMRAGIKGGWSGRKCLAMRTIMAAKFKLWKRSSTNSTLTHSILSSQCHRRLYSIVFTMGDILATLFFRWAAFVHDRTAVLRTIDMPYDRSYSQAPGLYADDGKEVLSFLAAKSWRLVALVSFLGSIWRSSLCRRSLA